MQKIMKIVSKVLFVAIVLILVVLGLVYFGIIDYHPNGEINLITLNQVEISMKKGDNYQLSADVYPLGIAHKSIKYESSNPDIVSVNQVTGYLEAKENGQATIIARLNEELYAKCIVSVGNVDTAIQSINIINERISLLINKEYQLKYTIFPSNATMHNLYYQSGDTAIAIVDKNGRIIAKNVGKTIISVYDSNSKATDSVIVEVYKNSSSDVINDVTSPNNKVPEVNSVNIKNSSVNLDVSGTINLEYEVLPKNSNQSLTWNSSNPKVATVDANGKVVAVNEGKTYIIATSLNGKTDKVMVTVNEQKISVKSIKIIDDDMTLKIGDARKIKVVITPSNATNQGVTYTSSNSQVVSVDNYGNLKALNEGMATIFVKTRDGTYTDSISVRVLKIDNTIKESSITLSETSINLNVGKTKNITYQLLPVNATYRSVKWTSSNSNVATVDNGMILAKGLGETIITITTYHGLKDTLKVYVKPIDVTGVSLNIKKIVMNIGDTSSIIPTITPTDATNKGYSWSSSNPSVATVDSNGIVTGVGAGTSIITIITSDGQYKDTCEVVVNEKINVPISNSSNLQSGYKLLADYQSGTLNFWIERGNVSGSTVYVTHVWVKDAYNQLKTALSPNYGSGLATSTTILEHEVKTKNLSDKALVAVNASGFVNGNYSYWLIYGKNGIKEWNNTSVSPIVIYDGKVLRNFTTQVMQDPLYSVSGLKKDGWIYQYDWSSGDNLEYNQRIANQVISDGVKYTWGFVGYLIKDGKINVNSGGAGATRQAICQIDKNNFVFVTGGNWNLGALATYLQKFDCAQAIGLDGGGSTSLSYKLKNTNSITKVRTSSRQIVDVLYFVEQ